MWKKPLPTIHHDLKRSKQKGKIRSKVEAQDFIGPLEPKTLIPPEPRRQEVEAPALPFEDMS